MRLDRFFTLSLFGPLCRAWDGALQPKLPILMYHSVAEGDEEDVRPYYRTSTKPERFDQQMKLLQRLGYRGVTLGEGLQALREGRLKQLRLVAITFDDGFQDFYTNAFPRLDKHGFKATVFLPTAFIGAQPIRFKSQECLTWKEVGELYTAGVEFGSHTVTHPKLLTLTWPDIRRELTDSRAEIEHHLGVPVTAFAYPYAFPVANLLFANRLEEELRNAGYSCCVTTELGRVGTGDNPYRLRRLPVNSLDDAALLSAKMDGGYDWLAFPQSLLKTWKRWTFGAERRVVAPV